MCVLNDFTAHQITLYYTTLYTVFISITPEPIPHSPSNLCVQLDEGGEWGCSSDGMLPTQVRFPSAERDFSPGVHFQCRFSYNVCTPLCAITCIIICAHVKDPVVHVRVGWIMETLKHPACTIGWVVWLCHSRLSPGKATQISHERNLIGTIQCVFLK